MSADAKRALSMPPTSSAPGDFDPVFAPRGDRIAFVRGASPAALDVWVMDADGGNERQITSAQWNELHTLSWMPNSEALLFTAGFAGDMRSYCVDLDDGTARPLPGLGANETRATVAANRVVFARASNEGLPMRQAPGRLAPARDVAPRDLDREGIKLVYSPSGEKIAWQSHRTGRAQIWIADRDGSGARALTDQSEGAWNPQWSADGTRIAFHSRDSGNADVYVVEVDSGRPRALTTHEAEDRYPTFSHDGRRIYFSSNRSGRSEIYRMPSDVGDAVRVTETGGTIVFESSDGRYLYYEYLEGSDGYTTEANPIWRIAVDGSREPEAVLPGWQRIENSWILSPGGIYYARNGPDLRSDFSIRYRDLDTGEDVEILSGPGRVFYPSVSPDEEAVFYSPEVPPLAELYVLENFR